MAKRLLEGPGYSKGSALRGNLMVDAFRGQMRVRAWPKKRGKKVAPGTKAYNDWFRDCLALIKKMEPGFMLWCMERTKGTNIYPRDLAMQLLSGRGVMLIKPDGTKYFPEAFMSDVSLSLDSISQTPGAILVRGEQLWYGLDPGNPNDVLTWNVVSNTPAWQEPAIPTDTSDPLCPFPHELGILNDGGSNTFAPPLMKLKGVFATKAKRVSGLYLPTHSATSGLFAAPMIYQGTALGAVMHGPDGADLVAKGPKIALAANTLFYAPLDTPVDLPPNNFYWVGFAFTGSSLLASLSAQSTTARIYTVAGSYDPPPLILPATTTAITNQFPIWSS